MTTTPRERSLNLPLTAAALVSLTVFVSLVGMLWPLAAPWFRGLSNIQMGILGSFVAGLFTVVGALPILLFRTISKGIEDTFMGFGAGVMLAATAFSLALPAIEQASADAGSSWIGALVLALGVGAGGGMMLTLHRFVPHEHFEIGPQSGADASKFKRVWLFILAISLHNFPEGLAVGVGFGGDDLNAGLTLAIGIGLQDMPEGLIVAIALLALGYSKATALGVALLTGLVQPVGGVIGAFSVSLMEAMLPWGLAFAAGAMLFVISHEIIPESHRTGHEGKATFGVLVGFVTLMSIEAVLQ